jgi:DNA topoisomerase-3
MLILAEKPSVAAAFAAALGVPKKGAFWENSDHCIVSALGHLLEDFAPEDYDPELKKWRLEDLPIIPEAVRFKAVANTEDQLEAVRKCFASHKGDPFLLATDAEREGELIGAEILDYVGFQGHARARRFWVSEALTKEVILKGIESAKPLAEYAPYRDQGYARQCADWLVGMNLTRLVSIRSGKLLHFGRVQTAVLGAVYEREKEIEGFSKEKYYEIKAVLDAAEPVLVKIINPENKEFPFRFQEGSPLLKEIMGKTDAMKSGIITAVEKEEKKVHPPKLFNLTALQKEAHKKFSYSPEQTLDIAQALYEKHKCLSYPRTPSNVMGDDNVGLVKEIFEKMEISFPELAAGTDPSLVSGNNKRVFNSADLQDHHALIPLALLPEGVSGEEKNVFSLVLKQFFNVFKPPYVYNSLAISGNISGYAFMGSGTQTIQEGWKTEKDEDDEAEENSKYTKLPEAGGYPVASLARQEKYTEPKKRHTYASLLSLMENPRGEDGKRLAGLGTPATRGSILKKLSDRGYTGLKGKNIAITDNGRFLIENILKNDLLRNFISIPETTRWEEHLHKDTAAFLSGIKEFVRDAVGSTSVDAYLHEKKSLGPCPECKGPVYEGQKSYYCGNYKAENPCKFAIWKEVCGASVSAADAQALLSGKKTRLKKCRSKAGKEFQAAFALEKGKVVFRFEDRKK